MALTFVLQNLSSAEYLIRATRLRFGAFLARSCSTVTDIDESIDQHSCGYFWHIKVLQNLSSAEYLIRATHLRSKSFLFRSCRTLTGIEETIDWHSGGDFWYISVLQNLSSSEYQSNQSSI